MIRHILLIIILILLNSKIWANNIYQIDNTRSYQFGIISSKILTQKNNKVEIIHNIHLSQNWILYYKQNNKLVFHITNDSKDLLYSDSRFSKFYDYKNQLTQIDQVFKNHFNIITQLYFINNSRHDVSTNLKFIACKDICVPYDIEINSKIYDIDHLVNDQKIYNKLLLYIKWLTLAFIGGLSLNIMPCVLPILLLKINSIYNGQETENFDRRKKFLSIFFGGTIIFQILAISTYFLQYIGKIVGWGLHFQNPYFTIFIIISTFILALNAWEKITFSINIPNILQKTINYKYQFIIYFIEGVIIAILASSCSTPIIGSVFIFSLSQKISIIMLLFFSTSCGLMLPYLLLALKPEYVNIFKKTNSSISKKWYSVKFLSGVIVLLTGIWFLYILSLQLSLESAIILFGLLILLKFCLQIFLHFYIKYVMILIILTSSFILPFKINQLNEQKEIAYNSIWEEFNEQKLAQYRREGKIIIVDVGAYWCINCKINHFLTLSPFIDNIMSKNNQNNIILMRKDITLSKSDNVMKFIHRYERSGIPFDIVYGLDKYVVLPTLFSLHELNEAIKYVNNK